MEELFDIVDENNHPLGLTKARSLVHKDGDWHQTVHIYVTNNMGEFLVHLRSPKKDLYPNRWDTKFGGHVPAGKDYDQTVLEELEQEIGLKVSLKNLKGGKVHSYDGGTNREHVKVYFYEYNDDLSKLSFSDNEVVEVKWMAPESILTSVNESPDNWTVSAKGFQKIIDEIKNDTI